MPNHSPHPSEALSRYQHLHDARLQSMPVDSLPEFVTSQINDELQYLYSKDVVVSAPSATMMIDDSGIRTYISQNRVNLDDNFINQDTLYAIDTIKKKIIGSGLVVRPIDPTGMIETNPSVGMTVTNQEYLGNAYGLRRLFLMNAAARTLLNGKLYSGLMPEPQAERHWQTLTSAGIAVQHSDRIAGCYNFIR